MLAVPGTRERDEQLKHRKEQSTGEEDMHEHNCKYKTEDEKVVQGLEGKTLLEKNVSPIKSQPSL